MKKFMRKIKEKRGEGELSMCISVILFVMIMVTAINLASVIIIRIEVNRYLDDLTSVLAGTGDFKDEDYLEEKENVINHFNNRVFGNVTITNVSFSESASEGYFDGVSVVQLGKPMTLTLSMTITLSNLGMDFPVNTETSRTRLSNKYAK